MAAGPEIAASQAVEELNRQIAALALENTRLTRENGRLSGELQQRSDDLTQSLEYQTAIREVLTAISRTTVDLAPVLHTLTDTALRLCEAEMGFICRRDGEAIVVVTAAGATPEVAADAAHYKRYQAARPFPIDRGSLAGRVVLAGHAVQIADIAADPEYRLAGATQLGKIRTQVGVPLVREGQLVGVLILSRQRVEPFTERQVGLLSTFADQAVIAMENARLLGELRESLDQQTATSEILQVINSSPSDLAPVFEAMLDRAVQLSDSAYGIMNVWEDGQYRAVALRGVPQGLLERWVAAPMPGPRNALMRIVGGEDVVHIEDLSAYESYRLGDERTRALVETGGARSLLAVALRKDGVLLGTLTAYRQEVRPFADKQVALLRSFAQQAVIAMENARLLGETREALERQTATTEVLEVINSSPGSLTPVFDTILAKATDLCEAEFGILWLYTDGFIRPVAHFNVPPAYAEFLRQGVHPVNPINAHGRLLAGEAVVHIADITADEAFVAGDPLRRALFDLDGGRAQITVPLRKDGAFLGDFVIYRKVPGPFSDKHIVLLQGFAAQAVIAIENARLLGELRESLDQQTATNDVLKTISRSSTNLGEVLDALLVAVARLCRADQAYMFRRHGELHELVAAHGVSAQGEAFIRSHPFRHERGTTSGRVALEKRVIHIHDVLTDPDYDYAEGQRNAGFRSMLGLPLLREDTLVGVFVLARTVVDPFSVREIELASGFADQALIAIENARLFEELRDRQAELRVTLDNTGDGVVMFDADLKLASWNGNFQAMLDIPDAFVAGRPGLDDYVGLLAGRGELGDGEPEGIVASYRERASRQWSAERTRPDGRIIEVRNNPVPDGGAVLIYADITERKQAEATIAAARDAAEEALEQQTATADILRAISESPTNVQPVLDAVVKAAVRFCGATDALIALREGEGATFVAHEGPIVMAVGSLALNRESAGGRSIVDGRTCHFPDIAALDPVEFAAAHAFARAHGFRAIVAAPLLRNNTAIGAVILRKAEAVPFTPHQIELLETFAAQAVIAIENVRLFTELRESLDQQSATSDVLKVIASSPTDVQPVLDAVAKAAQRFCGAADAVISLREDDEFVRAAHEGSMPFALGRSALDRSSISGCAIVDGRTTHIPDLGTLDANDFATSQTLAVGSGARAALAAPMLREGVAIGCILLRRTIAGPFSPKQIELLEAFAAQAVIAIENVRLFTELRASLDQQTATAEVLRVISQSPTDVKPVLKAVAAAARRFCNAHTVGVILRDGAELYAAATDGPLDTGPRRFPLDRGTVMGRSIVAGRSVHVPDLQLADPDEYPLGRTLSLQLGHRSILAAPLLSDGSAIGCILLRKPEPDGFTARQIELAETFAAQAVIAIQNVRLFTELRESLEQQTATAEILTVISQSPTDVGPVLSAVARAAMKFCGANDALVALRDGNEWIIAAHEGPIETVVGERRRLTRHTAPGRAMTDGEIVRIFDLQSDEGDAFPEGREIGARTGFRSALAAPLMRDESPIGAISLRRREAGAFEPRQVELLKTFAAQAVIAIENVRLFTELSESLDQQTATADILKAIASSPTDVQPVLDAVAHAALRFCGAPDAVVWLRDGDDNVVAAHQGTLTASLGMRRPMGTATFSGQAMLEGRTRQVADVDALDATVHAGVVALARQHKWRSSAAAPMMHGGKAIGCVVLRKPEPGLLSPRQITLLETFAAQAVIAIENVRLFTELLQRTDDLTQSLEQQTATADILRVIASSPTDVQPVLDAVAKAAVRFCGTTDSVVLLRDGDSIIPYAHDGPLAYEAGSRRQLDRSSTAGRATIDSQTIHIPDVEALDPVEFAISRRLARDHGFRAAVAAPLKREGMTIGTIILRKVEPGPFTPQQIQLLETFAAQAVIAIENVRLFTELRETLEQQTATAEVLQVISQSPTNVEPVLDAVAAAARRFCGAEDASIVLIDGDEIVRAAHEGSLSVSARGTREPLNRTTIMGRSIVDRDVVHVPNAAALDPVEYARALEIARQLGSQAALAAPMLREDEALGCILLRRAVPGPFTPRQIQLLQTFAAQAVIAIENVRLFTELRESLERLKAAQANLIQSEKMASLGQLSAGIAHEIKNPLNFVNNFANLSVELLDELKEAAGSALATLDEDKRAEVDETMELLVGNLGKIAEHGKRADGIVKSMLSHSRGGSGDWTPSDINALVEEALNLAYHGARAQDNEFNVTLERDFTKTPRPIDVVPQDVMRVFLNLFSNGFYAVAKRRRAEMQAGFRPTLKVSTRDLGEAVEIKVRDNGNGIPPEVREKLFQPFFTTKPTGEGTGLGLSISYDIVTQQHGGMIEVESEPESFTEFTVRLPRRRAPTSSSERA